MFEAILSEINLGIFDPMGIRDNFGVSVFNVAVVGVFIKWIWAPSGEKLAWRVN